MSRAAAKVTILASLRTSPESMPKYIIRIELHDAEEGDYQMLNFGMEVQGFSLSVTSSSGRVYFLPTGEYFREDDSTMDAVYDAAKKAALVAAKDYSLVIAETLEWKWRGLRRLG